MYWITGLSGAGKTTVGDALSRLLKEAGRAHVRLDGDALRQIFAEVDRHDRQSRLSLAHRYAGLCRLFSEQGLDVVCSTISLFQEIHRWNRENIRGYVEVFLDVDGDTLRRRDPKGIYRRARSGDLKDVAGVDLDVELPVAPDLTIRNDGGAIPEQVARQILTAGQHRQARRQALGTTE